MGDPEAEVVFPRLINDLVELMEAAYAGQLNEALTLEDNRTAATVFLVSGGYPGDYEKDKIISGLDAVEGSLVFHAGTKKSAGHVVTNGGRVIAVTSLADTLSDALALSNRNAQVIDFQGKYYRRDIGFEF
jgi:phosphoribosylamine--glycine ligase